MIFSVLFARAPLQLCLFQFPPPKPFDFSFRFFFHDPFVRVWRGLSPNANGWTTWLSLPCLHLTLSKETLKKSPADPPKPKQNLLKPKPALQGKPFLHAFSTPMVSSTPLAKRGK